MITKIKDILSYILCGIAVLLMIPVWLVALGLCLVLLPIFAVLGFFADLFAGAFD